MVKKLSSLILAVIFLIHASLNATPNIENSWNVDLRPSFRPLLLNKEVYFQPGNEQVDSSVGIPISTHSPKEFKESLIYIKKAKGESVLKDSQVFILGVPMGQEKEYKLKFQNVVQTVDFQDLNIDIKIMSVPPEKIFEYSFKTFQNMYQHFKYFWPSITRDYQKPTFGEVTSGLNSNLIVEIGTFGFLFSSLPLLDASATALSHATLIGSFVIFQKTLGNWINRPGSSHKVMFLKQALVSFPFILNFNIFGNLTPIIDFIKVHGVEAAFARFPNEIAQFATTQSFTMVLQTLFYYVFMSKGIRQWVNNQQGADNVRVARIMSNYNAIPFLTLDAIFLAMASTNMQPLLSTGIFDINMGHVLLGSLTAISSLFWIYPNSLNPTITWYKKYESFKKDFLNYFKSKNKICRSYFS